MNRLWRGADGAQAVARGTDECRGVILPVRSAERRGQVLMRQRAESDRDLAWRPDWSSAFPTWD